MDNKSKRIINVYKQIKINTNISKNLTYNKPLFINMKNENSLNIASYNINKNNCSISTKICSANSESPHNASLQKYNLNRVYSVKDFEIDSCSKTSLNFFSKYINTSISSSEDYNNNYETLTPSRQKIFPFIEEDKEQFTPYLGQKKSNDKNYQENKKESLNKNNIKENRNFSLIFNNSKKEIESTSLNLRNHFDEQLSKKYKIINKFQKLSFYQKKNGLNIKSKSRNKNNTTNVNTNYSNFIQLNGNLKNTKKQLLYKRKFDLSFQRENERKVLEWFYIHNIDISEREIYEKYVVLIQNSFRGYISRIKLYNKLKLYTCITVFTQIINNIYYRKYILLLKYCFQKIKKYFLINKNNLKLYKISFLIEGDQTKNIISANEIKELIEQNKKLQIKLNEFLINNNILKNNINNYKEFEFKYNNLLIQLEKLQNTYNNILKENNELIKELNSIKNNNNLKNDLIESQKIVNIIVEPINKFNKFKNIEIQNINNFLIVDTFKVNNNKKMQISSNISNLTLLNYNKTPYSQYNLKICNKLNKIEIINKIDKNKLKELIICKKINNINLISKIKDYNKFKIVQIEKQNNIYLSQLKDNKKLNNINYIIENKDNFQINKLFLKLYNNILEIDKINNYNIPILNSNTEEKQILKKNIQKEFLFNSQIIEEENKLFKDLLPNNLESHSDKKQNSKIPDKLIDLRSSLRISFRNKKIESQEVNVELEETNLSKEEILKRKRLRNLFKNKLFLLRDITRKYFLRFYYNGIYLKIVGKKPKPIENIVRFKSEEKMKKWRNTSYVEKGQYLRKIMSQKSKEKKKTLKKYFYLFRNGLDIQNIVKKLIILKAEKYESKSIKRIQLLSSFINKINNDSFSLLNIKRCLIIWKYKIKIENNEDLNKVNNYKNEIKDFDKENLKEDNKVKNNSNDNYIKNSLNRSYIYNIDDN